MKRKTFSLLGSTAAALVMAKVYFGFGMPMVMKSKKDSVRKALPDFGHRPLRPMQLRESQHLSRRGQRRQRHREFCAVG